MINVILSAFLLCAILLESTILAVPLVLYVVLFLILYQSPYTAFGILASGLLLDLFTGRVLGGSSLVFLFAYILWSRITKKVQAYHFLYRIIFFVLLLMSYHLLSYKTIYPVLFLRDFVLGISFLSILLHLMPRKGREKLEV